MSDTSLLLSILFRAGAGCSLFSAEAEDDRKQPNVAGFDSLPVFTLLPYKSNPVNRH